MPAAPDCVIKLGTNLNLVARFWRGKGWFCTHPPMQEHLNHMMETIMLDESRYHPDRDRVKIEILVKRMGARYVKPLVYDIRKGRKGVIY